MNIDNAQLLLKKILQEIATADGRAAVEKFSGLREVDGKVREVKTLLKGIETLPTSLVDDMEKDADFGANSRRVRLEALANYCSTALRFLESGVLKSKKQIFHPPELSRLTSVMPKLRECITRRWLEAQRCQVSQAYLSAVIMMGSILEALLLARISISQGDANRATRAPKDKHGKVLPFHDWKLTSQIDVAVELGWLKTDRGKFGHALRESRNIVHPYAEIASGADFDEGTCKTCWQVLNASVDDLLTSCP